MPTAAAARKKSSGELLGEGSFGCVFRPPIKCLKGEKPILDPKAVSARSKSSIDRTEVGKVFFEHKDFTRELKTSAIAAKIDPTGTKILVPSSSCESTRNEVFNHPAGNSCEKQSEYFYAPLSRPVYQLKMPYGGVRLDHYIAENKMTPKAFLEIMLPVINGLILLDKKEYCHQDIKASNILVAPSGEGIIIDYSLLIPYNKIYDPSNHRRWRFSYYPYPPEYKIYNHIQKHLSGHVLSEVKRNWYSFGDGRGKAYYALFGKKEIEDSIHDFFKYAVENGLTDADLQRTFDQFASKLDIYSVGMIFIDLNRSLDFKGYNRRSVWYRDYKKLIRSMSHPDPRERITALDAYVQMKQLLGKEIR